MKLFAKLMVVAMLGAFTAAVVVPTNAEARGRKGSHRVGGGAHGKGSHYVGGR